MLTDTTSTAIQHGAAVAPEVQPSTTDQTRAGRVLIVDDEALVTQTLSLLLARVGYTSVHEINDPREALKIIFSEEPPDVVITDVQMPEINGFEVLKHVRKKYHLSEMPLVVLTASEDQRVRDVSLQLGANDFLNKPICASNLAEVDARIRNLIVQKQQHTELQRMSNELRAEVRVRTKELFATRRETIHCLARAADSRDSETGQHVIRVGRYAAILSESLGMGRDFVNWIELAAQLHDVGKLSIPESILRKPGRLTDEERTIMETHCDAARSILLGATGSQTQITSPLLQMAARIAATHHEWWDGSGYPAGLSGEAIPMEGRITAVADVFDALSTRRSYKDAFDVGQCFEMLNEERGTHFDPRVIDAFFDSKYEILSVFHERAY